MAQTFDALVGQTVNDTVYWMQVAGRSPQKVSLHAAPVPPDEEATRRAA